MLVGIKALEEIVLLINFRKNMNQTLLAAIITTLVFAIPIPILSWLDRPRKKQITKTF
jgi:hypothetical protein